MVTRWAGLKESEANTTAGILIRWGHDAGRLGLGSEEAIALRVYAARLHRHYEAECCREVTPAEETRAKANEDRVRSIVATVPGLRVEFQPDPRGWPIILRTMAEAPDAYGVRVPPIRT